MVKWVAYLVGLIVLSPFLTFGVKRNCSELPPPPMCNRYVALHGSDTPGCGRNETHPCRDIAAALAPPQDGLVICVDATGTQWDNADKRYSYPPSPLQLSVTLLSTNGKAPLAGPALTFVGTPMVRIRGFGFMGSGPINFEQVQDVVFEDCLITRYSADMAVNVYLSQIQRGGSAFFCGNQIAFNENITFHVLTSATTENYTLVMAGNNFTANRAFQGSCLAFVNPNSDGFYNNNIFISDNIFQNTSGIPNLLGGHVVISIMYAAVKAYNNTVTLSNNYFFNNTVPNSQGPANIGAAFGFFYGLGVGPDYYGNQFLFEDNVFDQNEATIGGAVSFSWMGSAHPELPNTAIFRRCNFTRSTAGIGFGGAISMAASIPTSSSLLIVEDCHFVGNTAAGGGGGAIFAEAEQTMLLNNTVFIENKASGNGSAVYHSSKNSLTILNCHFISNQGLAAVFNGGGLLHIDGSQFSNNTGGREGGAVFSAANTSITRSTFQHGAAQEGGGALWIANPNFVVVSESTFEGNEGGYLSSFGGALLISGPVSRVVMSDSNFTNNKASNRGGAIAILLDPKLPNGRLLSGSFLVRNCTFENNWMSQGRGGALSVMNTLPGTEGTNYTILLQNNTFVGNTADQGGAISLEFLQQSVTVSISLNDSTLANNTARNKGGAICMQLPEYSWGWNLLGKR